jgi:ribosomal-protein-alanine N-acetyltransferase
MHMSVTIRSAGPDDVPAILAIEREASNAAHWTAEQYKQRVAEGMVLVAEEGLGVCGFVCGRVVAGEWEIENIVVAEASRCRGTADRLLQAFLLRAHDEAAVAVWLEVRESNQAARRLYEKHEFRETGRRRGYYRNPGEDAVLYGLGLQS